jgi:hypothetical protein
VLPIIVLARPAFLFSASGHAGRTRQIRARVTKNGDKSETDWIWAHCNNNGDCGSRSFCGERGWSAKGAYQRNPSTDQIGRKGWQSGIITFCRGVLHSEVLISHEAFNLKSFVEGGKFCRGRGRTIQNSDCWCCGSLCMRICQEHRRSDRGDAYSPCDSADHFLISSVIIARRNPYWRIGEESCDSSRAPIN